jgi:hypothetical protein
LHPFFAEAIDHSALEEQKIPWFPESAPRAGLYRFQTNRAPSREGALLPASFAPLTRFREFYFVARLSAQRPGLSGLFSRHLLAIIFRTPFLFIASFLVYASQHLPMLRLRARFKPLDTENPWRPLIAGLASKVDLILPSLPSLTSFGEFNHVRASCLLQQPSLEVLLSIFNT